MVKPRILILLQYYLPGYRSGGPVSSLLAFGELLGPEFDLTMLAYDRDSGGSGRYEGVVPGEPVKQGQISVIYIEKSLRKWLQVARLLRSERVDVWYLQSLWNPCFTLWPLLLRRLGWVRQDRVVLAPRNELSHGALNIRGARKRLCLRLAKWCGLFHGLDWQASTPQEVNMILTAGVADPARVHVACDLKVVESPNCISAAPRGSEERLQLVFLSRISPMKNLEMLLKALAIVGCAVRLDIYGPGGSDTAYFERCRQLWESLPANIRAHYHGPVAPSQVSEIFSCADAFVLPTHGENYGHVIVESLLAGCPVITSTKTPWNGLKEAGCGANVEPDDVAALAAEICTIAQASTEQRHKMRSNAREYAANNLRIEEAIEAHRRMFARVLSSSVASE